MILPTVPEQQETVTVHQTKELCHHPATLQRFLEDFFRDLADPSIWKAWVQTEECIAFLLIV